MPLVLALRKGHDFFVGDHRVVVSDIKSAYEAVLRFEDGSLVTVNDTNQAEIHPGVKVMVGTPKNQNQRSIIKLLLDGPGQRILRGDLYREPKAGVTVCTTCKGKRVLTTTEVCKTCHGFGCNACNSTGRVEELFQCPDCGDENEAE